MAKQTVNAKYNALIRQAIITLLVGGGTTLGVFYLSAMLIVHRTISQGAFALFGTFSLCLGCCISSIVLALQRKNGGLLCGLICSTVFGIVLVIGSVCHGIETITAISMMRLVFLSISGCTGGCFGVAKAMRRAKRHR